MELSTFGFIDNISPPKKTRQYKSDTPKQEVEMPVSFFIDPAIKDDKFISDLSEITLSYTMFIK